MPHLSPIFWLGLYVLVAFVFVFLCVSFEFFNVSLKR